MSDQPQSGVMQVIGGNTSMTERYTGALMNTFGPPQRILLRGNGCDVFDADGAQYLDLLGGIAVNALGHAHPTVVGAVTAQLNTLGHISNFFSSGPQIGLAEQLIRVTGGDDTTRVFFTNSGTEAVETAIKIARRTGRPRILAATNAFHGRSTGALALTYKPAYREPFEPLLPGVDHVPFGDPEALAAQLDESVSAVVLEPIQGEGGILPAPGGYFQRVRELCDRAGALLIVDEIQTGMGRTGSWLALQRIAQGVRADVVTLAKGLGSGFPIGAVVAHGAAASLLGSGSHGTTFGGNPPACAAGLATVHVIERDGLLQHVVELGAQWASELAEADPMVAEVRGLGLLLGVRFTEDLATRLATAALAAGFIVNAVSPNVIRLAPPLIITAAQAQSFTRALPDLIAVARQPDPT